MQSCPRAAGSRLNFGGKVLPSVLCAHKGYLAQTDCEDARGWSEFKETSKASDRVMRQEVNDHPHWGRGEAGQGGREILVMGHQWDWVKDWLQGVGVLRQSV